METRLLDGAEGIAVITQALGVFQMHDLRVGN